MKLLKKTYKTYEGARKRCAFENRLAKSEFERGDKAKHYCYSVVQEGNVWRVARLVKAYPFAPTPGQPDRCEHCTLPFMDHYNGECPK